jgi:hypothetical protein
MHGSVSSKPKRRGWIGVGVGSPIAHFGIALGIALGLPAADLQRADILQGKASAEQDQETGGGAGLLAPDPAELEALVDDATPQSRVVRQIEGFRWALAKTRALRSEHFEALHARDLAPDLLGAIAGDAGAFRARAFRARGWVREWKPSRSGDSELDHDLILLELERGGRAFFAVSESLGASGAPVEGSFVRADGLFVKLQNEELAQGWVEAPLFIGPRAVPSYPDIGRVHELSSDAFSSVQDDSLEAVSGMPFEERWRLLAYARDVAPDAIDWSGAPVLDGAKLHQILADGDPWRGLPVRLPVSELLDVRDADPGENPARLTSLCAGWLGHRDWKGPVPAVRFEAPFARGGMKPKDHAGARAFFLKNLAFDEADGSTAIAPVFVVQAFEAYTSARGFPMQGIFALVAATFLGIGALTFVLLARDRKRAAELQDELVRRSRMRRTHNEQSPAT